MNRVKQLFKRKNKDILNVYFTAGHPHLHDTVTLASQLTKCGVDLIELGMPYSDPLADGLTIQQSSMTALKNGMTLNLLFEQVNEFRKYHDTPLILMGYLNQVMQYGKTRFVEKCHEAGIDGLILPDLPMDIYEKEYMHVLESNDLAISFLITPQTSEERIRNADQLSSGFLYVVSQSSITGKTGKISSEQQSYFNRINEMNLTRPKLIGFGIHNRATYQAACANSNGAIIGSAFIRAVEGEGNIEEKVSSFIKKIR
jgi:tryptophan synthase alpha chain